MSLSSSLSSALSGLTAATRSAEVVASNIANARTPGYGRREVTLSARMAGDSGQGVSVGNTQRFIDRALLNDRRIAGASAAGAETTTKFQLSIEQALGIPGGDFDLVARIAAFDAALVNAASRPESDVRLLVALDAAKGLVNHISAAADTVQTLRGNADAGIQRDVSVLNDTLADIADINGRIRKLTAEGRDASALTDQRQLMVDRISEIVPIRETQRELGQIALYTTGGAVLMDGRAAVFGFSSATLVTAEMTQASGALSGLTLNGRPLSTGVDSLIAGGTLQARFELRDAVGPAAQVRLDALARNLVEHFSAPGLDPTLAPDAAGLFSDAGNIFEPANASGLAQRLELNAAIDPAQGGAIWRLRDGLGAAEQGPAGRSTLIVALSEALLDRQTAAAADFSTGNQSFAGLAGDLVSAASSERILSENRMRFTSAQATALQQLELEAGVDTDQELQTLLRIEQAYGANAKVIQAVDRMIQLLTQL